MPGAHTNGHAKKVLVVFGATGKQGGSVIKSVLGDPTAASMFSIRAITRDPSKPAAQELVKMGCECVSADLDDKESLLHALQGAYAVYAVTNFWEKKSAAAEIQQGKNIADAAKACGVQHLIWSSLMNVTELSGGKLSKVAHFDSKAAVEQYIREQGLPATFFMPGFYMSNIPGQSLNNAQGGAWNLALPIPPDAPMPLFDADADTGKFVKGILLHRDRVLGARVYGATGYYTPQQILADFQAVKARDGPGGAARQVPEEAFKKVLAAKGLPAPIQDEMLENLLLMPQFGYYGGADLGESQACIYILLCMESIREFYSVSIGLSTETKAASKRSIEECSWLKFPWQTIPEDLSRRGYKDQVCVDFSPVVVAAMSKRHLDVGGITWKRADVRQMDQIPSEESVDVAFDKGTLDPMIHGSPWDPPTEVLDNTCRYIREVHFERLCVFRVLKPHATFIYVTYRQPHFIKPLLNCEGVQWDIKVDVLGGSERSLDYHGFVPKKATTSEAGSAEAKT
ncbi:hypothetical protein CLAIMM_04053 [Cladophialophora immunda]|nr:hypothetical protein CLAIMM_04053 [Cladophialophora immunda]